MLRTCFVGVVIGDVWRTDICNIKGYFPLSFGVLFESLCNQLLEYCKFLCWLRHQKLDYAQWYVDFVTILFSLHLWKIGKTRSHFPPVLFESLRFLWTRGCSSGPYSMIFHIQSWRCNTFHFFSREFCYFFEIIYFLLLDLDTIIPGHMGLNSHIFSFDYFYHLKQIFFNFKVNRWYFYFWVVFSFFRVIYLLFWK